MNITHRILKVLAKQLTLDSSPFRWIDLYTAQYISDLYPDNATITSNLVNTKDAPLIGDLFDQAEARIQIHKDDLVVLTLLCSALTQLGQTHLKLNELPLEMMSRTRACAYRPSFQTSEELIEGIKEINLPTLIKVIPGKFTQEESSINSFLVIQEDKLYLARYWQLTQRFNDWLNRRHLYLAHLSETHWLELSQTLAKVFPDVPANTSNETAAEEPNWQAVAAAHTLIHPLSIITGGPGTGKTTTAASLLYLLMEKHKLIYANALAEGKNVGGIRPLKVRLLAPTGKAAVRLADAIKQQLKALEVRLSNSSLTQFKLSDHLPDSGETVHRFLYEMGGLKESLHVPRSLDSDAVLMRRSGTEPNSHSVAKKAIDIIIVDESSMMDLALIVELISVIPDRTQLILLGDHFQLPAIDPGQVFTDCVERFSHLPHSPESLKRLSLLTGYADNALKSQETSNDYPAEVGFQPLCELRKTYRFGGDLKVAAEHIKSGELSLFKEKFWCGNQTRKHRPDVVWYDLELEQTINLVGMIQAYGRYFELVAKGAELQELATQFERYQLLCSTLEGPLGVHALNKMVEHYYAASCSSHGKNTAGFYHGKAILVTQNHPHLGIYNGDIGFMIRDPKNANLNVAFPVKNQQAIVVPPARIKAWQPAYAMSVHKSQGSEYAQVGIVLADYAKELLTRPLLYTALTRAKNSCEIWAGSYTIEKAFEVNKKSNKA